MFIALDKNNERISIEEINPNSSYFCPICGEKVRIKAINSDNIKTHFAHIKKCTDTFDHDMSEWHYNWQLFFPKQCREIVLEKNGIKHRADILINNTVIEFQHSPITNEEINKRNQFYTSLGYSIVWVFDANNQIKNELRDTIDPLICNPNELCWKRKKAQFTNLIPFNIIVFLNYSLDYLSPNNNILILIDELKDKYFTFKKTNDYIYPNNFLKQFGVETNEGILPVSEMLNNYIDSNKRKVSHNQHQIITNSKVGRRWHL